MVKVALCGIAQNLNIENNEKICYDDGIGRHSQKRNKQGETFLENAVPTAYNNTNGNTSQYQQRSEYAYGQKIGNSKGSIKN